MRPEEYYWFAVYIYVTKILKLQRLKELLLKCAFVTEISVFLPKARRGDLRFVTEAAAERFAAPGLTYSCRGSSGYSLQKYIVSALMVAVCGLFAQKCP